VEKAGNSGDHLFRFLKLIWQSSKARHRNSVAQSLGNRVLLQALKTIAEENGGSSQTMFDEVVLAAPDVDVTGFKQAYPALLKLAGHSTIYASSHDTALKASERFWGASPRIGESGRRVYVFDSVDTVDVSNIDFQLFGMGHAYFVSNRLVIDDITTLFSKRLPPPRVHLQMRSLNDQIYWQFPR